MDYLSIVGDTADNIPGVKGIGPKGAEKLLKTYGTLEGVYANLRNIKGANKGKLEKSSNIVGVCKSLATIRKDIDVRLVPEEMAFSVSDFSKGQKFYKELEFQGV